MPTAATKCSNCYRGLRNNTAIMMTQPVTFKKSLTLVLLLALFCVLLFRLLTKVINMMPAAHQFNHVSQASSMYYH